MTAAEQSRCSLSERLPELAGAVGSPVLLDVSAVSYAYPQAKADVLRDLTLDVHEGEFVSVVGAAAVDGPAVRSASVPAVRIITVAVIVGGWEAVARSGLLRGTVLPPFSGVVAGLYDLVRQSST